jgi:hypothetical protein
MQGLRDAITAGVLETHVSVMDAAWEAGDIDPL